MLKAFSARFSRLRPYSQALVFHQHNDIHTGVPSQDSHYDVIVSGGGMVGSTMAASLGTNNIKNTKVKRA